MSGERHQQAIIQGKLFPATGTRKPLPRPRLDLIGQMLAGTFPVTLIAAPAGYGKSTLMAQWHGQLTEHGVSCAWLSLDPDDNDTARFLRYLLAALRTAGAPIGDDVEHHLIANFASVSKSVLEAIAADLARIENRIVLFLDDLHLVEGPELRAMLDWLINYAPPRLQYVIGTREDTGLRLSGLKVRRQLLQLGSEQLQFDPTEAALFYGSRLGRDLSPSHLQILLTKTEGWPAALELAAFVISESDNPEAFIRQFAGTDSSLVDYLCDMVLSRLDVKTRESVFRISMFERICEPLVQEVINDGAADLLSRLRSRNLFMIPLDRSREWVRFHHLVGEFFRETYRRIEPQRARECLAIGARWFYANGYIEEAVNHMIRAEQWEQATRWVAESVEELVFRRGYHQTILRWMNALPEACVDLYPVIRIQYAFALSFYPRNQEVDAQVYRLRALLGQWESHTDPDAEKIAELRCAVELQTTMSSALRDDGEKSGEMAAEWLSRWPEASLRRKGVMGNVLSFGFKTQGHIDDGLQTIAETRRWLEQSEGFYPLAWTAYVEAVLLLKRGDYLEARGVCERGLDLIDRKLYRHPGQTSLLLTIMAGIAYEFDEIEQARGHLEIALGNVNEYAPADAVIIAYATQSRIERLLHDENAALNMLKEGQAVGERRGLPRVTLSLAAEECRTLARAGRCEEARLVAKRLQFHDLPTSMDFSSLRSNKALRAASRYLLKEAPQAVVRALAPAIHNAGKRNLAHRSVELLVLRAVAQCEDGNWSGAWSDLRSALTIAAPKGYLRVFLDEGHALTALFDRVDIGELKGSEAAPLARRVKNALIAPDSKHDSSSGTAEPLTKRELFILKRLHTGLSNKEIAEAIFVSEGTLKWHLHNVYGKLNVKNRAGAMTRARALGFL